MLKEMSTRHIQQASHIEVTQEDIPARRSFISHDRHKRQSADNIAELWCIGKNRAMAALDAATQCGTRSAILPLSRRYRADRRCNLRRLTGDFSTDLLCAEKRNPEHDHAIESSSVMSLIPPMPTSDQGITSNAEDEFLESLDDVPFKIEVGQVNDDVSLQAMQEFIHRLALASLIIIDLRATFLAGTWGERVWMKFNRQMI